MANLARGEAVLTIGGQEYSVALNLGTLAELESAFGVEDFSDIFRSITSARSLLKLITATMAANGFTVDEHLIRAMTAAEAMAAGTALLQASGLVAAPEAAQTAGDGAPLGDANAGTSG